MKIKDRFVLGLISGMAGNAVKMAIDEISLRKKISKRSFRSTAAGVMVGKKKHADSATGQVLGGIFDFGFAALGGVATVYFLSKTGRDHLIIKGTASGLIIGSFITSVLSGFPGSKVVPKDASSNLSYMLSHVVYGLVTASVASALGHPALFDVPPLNDYLAPTEKTSEMNNQFPAEKRQEQPIGLH